MDGEAQSRVNYRVRMNAHYLWDHENLAVEEVGDGVEVHPLVA